MCFINHLVFLSEKNLQNPKATYVVVLKIEKNMNEAKRLCSNSSRLFDPHGKSISDPMKNEHNETGETPAKFMDLLEDLSNKMI
jgi:hypothetical protein